MTLTELKAKATELGLTPDEVRQHGNLSKKATWEAAIAEFGEWKKSVDTHCEQMGIPQWTYPEDEPAPGDDSVQNQVAIATVDDIAVTVNQVEIDGEMVAASEVVNPDNLPALAQTDERFKLWKPWMIPGATFTTSRQQYTILYFDPSGNCNAKGTDDRWHSFRLETIVNTATDDSVQNQLPPSEPIPPIEPDETIDMEGWHRWDEKLKVWIQENPDQALENCYQPESDSLRDQLLKRMEPYIGDCIRLEDFEQLQNEPLDEATASVYLGLLDGSERVLAGVTP